MASLNFTEAAQSAQIFPPPAARSCRGRFPSRPFNRRILGSLKKLKPDLLAERPASLFH